MTMSATRNRRPDRRSPCSLSSRRLALPRSTRAPSNRTSNPMTSAIFRTARSGLFALCLSLALAGAAQAAQGVVVTVNDQPITNFDIDQRAKLLRVMGRAKEGGDERRNALQSLIDDNIKLIEARKYKLEPTEAMIDKQLE